MFDDIKGYGFNMTSFNNNHALNIFYGGQEKALEAVNASGLVHADVVENLAGESIKTMILVKPVEGDVLAALGKWIIIKSHIISEVAIKNGEYIVTTIKPIKGFKINASGASNQDQYKTVVPLHFVLIFFAKNGKYH